MKRRESVDLSASQAGKEGSWEVGSVQCLVTTWHGSNPALVTSPPIGPNSVVGSAGTNHSSALTGISSNQMTSC